jgi:hypothetical protein
MSCKCIGDIFNDRNLPITFGSFLETLFRTILTIIKVIVAKEKNFPWIFLPLFLHPFHFSVIILVPKQ